MGVEGWRRLAVVVFLVCLAVEPTLASVAGAGEFGKPAPVELSSADGGASMQGTATNSTQPIAGELKNVVHKAMKAVIAKADTLIEHNEGFAAAWRGIVSSRLERAAQVAPEPIANFLRKPAKEQFAAYRSLVDEENLLQIPLILQTESMLPVLTGAIITHMALVWFTIFIMATTRLFRKPKMRLECGDVVPVCNKGLPQFVCTNRRLFLFVIVFPTLLVSAVYVASSATEYLRSPWNYIFFAWGIFAVVVTIHLIIAGSADRLAKNLRGRLASMIIEQKKKDDKAQTVDLVDDDDELLAVVVETIPKAFSEMGAFLSGKDPALSRR